MQGYGSILGSNKSDYYLDEKKTNATSSINCEADANYKYIFSISGLFSGTIMLQIESQVSYEKLFMLNNLRNLDLTFIFVI